VILKRNLAEEKIRNCGRRERDESTFGGAANARAPFKFPIPASPPFIASLSTKKKRSLHPTRLKFPVFVIIKVVRPYYSEMQQQKEIFVFYFVHMLIGFLGF
jgi:hypothetical protein